MAAFKEVADIQTADMLKLPVPKANFHTEVIQPSEFQKEMIKGLAERAEKIRAGGVDPHVDNMLRITNDGRKLALDNMEREHIYFRGHADGFAYLKKIGAFKTE